MSERAYGIDLGTTRSCIAYIDDHGESKVVTNAEGSRTTPSVVYFPREGEPVVGMAAKRAAREHPELVVEAIKREMGLEWAREFHGERYSPEDVSAAILRQLVADAKRETGDCPSRVVITVPASFTTLQKDATRAAARRAGLKKVELLPEPLAAALTYRGGDDGVLVYDLGGGTFDATLVDIEEPTFTALGTVGDQNLGGREWDWDIARLFAQRFSENTGVPPDALTGDPVTRGHLLDRAEAAKIGLATDSLEGRARTTQEISHGDRDISLELTLEEFDEATRHRVLPTIGRLEYLLSTTGYRLERLTRILLVGGSTLMPQVQAALRDRFPRVARDIVDPHMAVAKGAAIRAHYGERMEIRAADIERSDELGDSEHSDDGGNWFGLLELDPSGDGAERIEAAIDARRLEWSRQTSDLDPDRAHRARHHLALIPAMRRDLLSGAERRRERAGEASRAKENPGAMRSTGEERKAKRVRRQIRFMKEQGHSWKPSHVAKLVKKHSIDRMRVEQLLREQGIVVDRVDLTPEEASDIATLLGQDDRGAADLYHFLSKEADSAVGPDAGPEDLKERAQQIFLKRNNTHPVRGRLAALAMKHFETEREKRRYDRTLARDVINGPKLETNLDWAFFDDHATKEEFESLLTAASKYNVTRKMAREAILARAEEEGWTVAEAESRSQPPRAGLRELRDAGAIASRVSADRDALMALYRSAGGRGWDKSVNWGTNAPLGDWSGVRVDGGGRVTELRLGDNNLTGTIPRELGELANLKRLYLSENGLRGPIPPKLGELANLEGLWLRGNDLTGPIPRKLGGLANLKLLDLDGNKLTGPVPPELGRLANLATLDLRNNDLTDAIPRELGNLANLKRLWLHGNDLTGKIPPELGRLANLENLSLRGNDLTGPIPAELGGLANLKELDLRNNNLWGSIHPKLASLKNLAVHIDHRNRDWSDRDALMALYRSAGGRGWGKNVNWGTDAPLGDWSGVRVDDGGRVTELYLQKNDLKGSIPAELGALAHLKTLWLRGNGLAGAIPPELGRLANLENLSLHNNRLTGTIPGELGALAHLKILWLHGNGLTGSIPPELGDLANLEKLSIGGNDLTGPIPRELGGLANLTELWLYDNDLTGRVPPELGRLAHLKKLSLRSNGLTGPVPPELGRLSHLDELTLYNNGLTGPIPPELGDLASLTYLGLHGNGLTGPIPRELGGLANLKKLSLGNNDLTGTIGNNDLTGTIPRELGGLANLTGLWLYGNDLTGTIPRELGRLANLENLSLYKNRLTGTIPRKLGGLANLTYLGLHGNGLTGPIPHELGGLANLKKLSLHSNGLTGTIPRKLGGLANLTGLWLHDNDLEGTIPSELGRLANLATLDLRNNNLWGSIHPKLASLKNLAVHIDHRNRDWSDRDALMALYRSAGGRGWGKNVNWGTDAPLGDWSGVRVDDGGRVTELNLSGNRLTGTVPRELGGLANLKRLSLGDNRLTGTIPPELGDLTNLKWLWLHYNDLTGPIPPELGGLASLEKLSLSGNRLTGPIPTELGALANLKQMGLENNRLTGTIPRALGRLANLKGMDLGHNRLTGTIPPELAGLARFWWLPGNDLTGWRSMLLRARWWLYRLSSPQVATAIVVLAFGAGMWALWSPERSTPDLSGSEPGGPISPDPMDAELTGRQEEEALGLGRETWRSVQAGLAEAGFSPGGTDGIPGSATRDALRRWQSSLGLPESGYLDAAQVATLEAAGATERARAAAAAEELRRPGREFRDCEVCPEMVVVPPGSYLMGTQAGARERHDEDEHPRHTVRIGYALAVGRYEVTFDEWDACVRGGGCGGYRPNDLTWGRGRRPVLNVSWEDARGYALWLSRETGETYRLLSEAEWEYVARGGTLAARYWGENESGQCAYANGADAALGADTRIRRSDGVAFEAVSCNDGYGATTAPVGTFRANGFGLHDMLGNLSEWTEDCYNDSYASAPTDGNAWTARDDCSRRVVRGGSFVDPPQNLRSAGRYSVQTGDRDRSVNIGFRVARTIPLN